MIKILPHVNATLNMISTILLIFGYTQIRQRKIRSHKFAMISAFIVSIFFLISYSIYHFSLKGVSKPFDHPGIWRIVYFSILIPHIILAFTIPPLAIITLIRAWRKRFPQHKKIARWTLPIWLYVSITGVLIYFMLYHLLPILKSI